MFIYVFEQLLENKILKKIPQCSCFLFEYKSDFISNRLNTLSEKQAEKLLMTTPNAISRERAVKIQCYTEIIPTIIK